jgi:hypothetical protein
VPFGRELVMVKSVNLIMPVCGMPQYDHDGTPGLSIQEIADMPAHAAGKLFDTCVSGNPTVNSESEMVSAKYARIVFRRLDAAQQREILANRALPKFKRSYTAFGESPWHKAMLAAFPTPPGLQKPTHLRDIDAITAHITKRGVFPDVIAIGVNHGTQLTMATVTGGERMLIAAIPYFIANHVLDFIIEHLPHDTNPNELEHYYRTGSVDQKATPVLWAIRTRNILKGAGRRTLFATLNTVNHYRQQGVKIALHGGYVAFKHMVRVKAGSELKVAISTSLITAGKVLQLRRAGKRVGVIMGHLHNNVATEQIPGCPTIHEVSIYPHLHRAGIRPSSYLAIDLRIPEFPASTPQERHDIARHTPDAGVTLITRSDQEITIVYARTR